jgi:hypothetical protein
MLQPQKGDFGLVDSEKEEVVGHPETFGDPAHQVGIEAALAVLKAA